MRMPLRFAIMRTPFSICNSYGTLGVQSKLLDLSGLLEIIRVIGLLHDFDYHDASAILKQPE